MKIEEAIKKRINEGRNPEYITNRGKLLWIDNKHYDDYSSSANCKILIDEYGRFWGYSNDPRIKKNRIEIKMKNEIDTKTLKLYAEAYRKWGIKSQFDMVIEEMAELTKEILKSRRKGLLNNQKEIVEELVDVEIMIEQLKFILSEYLHSYHPLYKNLREEKLNRLKKILEDIEILEDINGEEKNESIQRGVIKMKIEETIFKDV